MLGSGAQVTFVYFSPSRRCPEKGTENGVAQSAEDPGLFSMVTAEWFIDHEETHNNILAPGNSWQI